MSFMFTRCQDQHCPLHFNCLRFDPSPMPDPKQAYFAGSPRTRNECLYYEASDHTVGQRPKPLTGEWPKDPEGA